MANNVKWENADRIWNEFDRLWENAFLEAVKEIPQTGDSLQKAITGLEPTEKKKLIKLVCKMNC